MVLSGNLCLVNVSTQLYRVLINQKGYTKWGREIRDAVR